MKQTILIHGAPDKSEFYNTETPSPSNELWFPWLQKQCALRDELCQVLEFPKPYDPIYSEWVSVFESLNISSNSVLIGHSCGGGFLLRYLSEHPDFKVQKVILVAPWIDPNNELTDSFFKFVIDESLGDRTDLHLFISSDDDQEMQTTVKVVREKISNITMHEFSDKGHFCEKEFPELLDILK